MATQSIFVLFLTVFSLIFSSCATPKKTPAEALMELQGSWKVESAQKAGKPMSMGVTYVEIQGDQMDRITTNNGVFKRKITVDANTLPRTMDFEIISDSGDEKDQGKIMPGIYKIENGKLWICHAPPGGTRPKEFVSNSENQNVLAVSKRVPLRNF